jgi:ketol-acid reductoisomerase
VNQAFVGAMLEQGIPIEAIVTELVLSGEVERTYRLVREVGYSGQFEFHSPTSQYGQLSRRDAYAGIDIATTMRELVAAIVDGRFADEWDAERDAGHPTLASLKQQHVGGPVADFDREIRTRLGQGAIPAGNARPSGQS